MTTTTTNSASEPTPSEVGRAGEDFTTGEGLRALLCRLHEADARSWREDPVARALMQYAAEKYEPLARKHDLDPWEAATAAFEVMRTRAAQEAADPWAVITHAVRITCIFEQRAQGLLCSVHQARRPHISAFHDPERFSDRETPLTDYHPAFHIPDPHDDAAGHSATGTGSAGATMSAAAAVEDAMMLFTELGWPGDAARAAIDYVCTALTRTGSRQSTFEALRRDRYALAFLDLPRTSWSALLRALLGHPNPAYAATNTGRGVLLRLLLGESPAMLLRDDDLVLTIALASPARERGDGS